MRKSESNDTNQNTALRLTTKPNYVSIKYTQLIDFMAITTTEEWVSGYLKRLVFFAENEAEQSGFDKKLGSQLVSFCLYSAVVDMPDKEFQSQLIKFAELCSKSVEDCKNFFDLYAMIANNSLQFSHYVNNTQAFDYIKTHHFLNKWRQGNGGNFVAV